MLTYPSQSGAIEGPRRPRREATGSVDDDDGFALGGIVDRIAVDDCPAPREDVIRFVSERSPIAASAFAKAAGLGSGKVAPLSPASKRVRNDKMKRDLGAVLEYPTYAEGMAAVMDGDLSPFTPASIKHLL